MSKKSIHVIKSLENPWQTLIRFSSYLVSCCNRMVPNYNRINIYIYLKLLNYLSFVCVFNGELHIYVNGLVILISLVTSEFPGVRRAESKFTGQDYNGCRPMGLLVVSVFWTISFMFTSNLFSVMRNDFATLVRHFMQYLIS